MFHDFCTFRCRRFVVYWVSVCACITCLAETRSTHLHLAAKCKYSYLRACACVSSPALFPASQASRYRAERKMQRRTKQLRQGVKKGCPECSSLSAPTGISTGLRQKARANSILLLRCHPKQRAVTAADDCNGTQKGPRTPWHTKAAVKQLPANQKEHIQKMARFIYVAKRHPQARTRT